MDTRGDILIVDDDDDLLEVIGLVLRSAGYTTRTASNGRRALDAVAVGMPALILLDMLMPVMDGVQFVQEFRAKYGGDVPIVVLTAAEHARRRCSGIDVQDVLTKPFDVGELLRVVAQRAAAPRPPNGWASSR
jgi:two-component system OmpR family response regulator